LRATKFGAFLLELIKAIIDSLHEVAYVGDLLGLCSKTWNKGNLLQDKTLGSFRIAISDTSSACAGLRAVLR